MRKRRRVKEKEIETEGEINRGKEIETEGEREK